MTNGEPMTPERARAWILIGVRDLFIPVCGVILTFFLAITHQLTYWQLPFLAGMMLTPLVARGGRVPSYDVKMPDPDFGKESD